MNGSLPSSIKFSVFSVICRIHTKAPKLLKKSWFRWSHWRYRQCCKPLNLSCFRLHSARCSALSQKMSSTMLVKQLPISAVVSSKFVPKNLLRLSWNQLCSISAVRLWTTALENRGGLQQPRGYLQTGHCFGIFASFSPFWVRGRETLYLTLSGGRIL